MSRQPLLLRSSPALGNASSYGGIFPTELDRSDTGHADRGNTDKHKNSHRGDILRRVTSLGDEQPYGRERSRGPGRTSFQSEGTSRRRKSISGFGALAQDIRFGSGGLPAVGALDKPTKLLHSTDSDADDEDSSDHISIDVNDEYPSDDSPYAQVRASVSPYDNTSLSINTPRMWFFCILFAIFGSSTNLFFSLRYPSVSITPVIALLVVHPFGLLWDQIFKRDKDPEQIFVQGSLAGSSRTSSPHHIHSRSDAARGSWRRRLRLWLGQGRWNEKEHCCVFISSNVSFGFAFATDVIVEQTKFYNQDLSIYYQILLTISTQVIGYALAGLTRRFLVRPSGMIWPAILVSTGMFTTLHRAENKPANGWIISRFRFFLFVFLGSVAFYFLPGLLFPALGWFNIVTWFAPKNVVVANLFGVASGLGMFPMTFDWSQIAYIGSPLVTPFWAALNIVGGLILVMWIAAPIMYYSNVMYSSFMPILSSAVFDNTGNPYDVSKILTKDFIFDHDAYEKYSRVFLPITYVLSYALQFAAVSALISHTACWHGRDIWQHWRSSWKEIKNEKPIYEPLAANLPGEPLKHRVSAQSDRSHMSEPGLDHLMTGEDVHNRLMRGYEDVPMMWYLLTGLGMLAIGIFVVEYFPVFLPWYGLLMAIGICAVLFIPIGIVMAITGQQNSIYLICQLICGMVFPGRPVANMVFVTYGYISSTQGLKFSSDLKLGHYMKIPPKILFKLQLSATIVSSLTQIGVLNWMLENIPGICTPDAISGFTCPIARVHFNGSILWGVVGPQRFFGPGALYRPLVWAFLVGAIAPIILFLIHKRVSKRAKAIIQHINPPLLFGSLSWIPPATGLNFSVWALVCWYFNYIIKNRKGDWWTKYTMTLSAALDSGLAVGVVVVFFGIVWPGWMDGFKWWGTEVYKQGCDWNACPWKTLKPGESFGPGKW
ncbi:hypothetical protein EG327_006661 [Venturia inaequalis]|nr:hypothetical protein EG327_006661 [Venturia inaequalis]